MLNSTDAANTVVISQSKLPAYSECFASIVARSLRGGYWSVETASEEFTTSQRGTGFDVSFCLMVWL